MLNQTAKNHFSQVAMIESQYESKRKNMLPSSSLLTNKSPMRERQLHQYERQNHNNMNTPTRIPNTRNQVSNNSMMMGNGVNKISLSPLRSRKMNNNEASITSVKSSALSRRKFTEPTCDQHKSKQAEFILESEGECFYFCQTCAIPLIAQGFPCMKMQAKNGYQQEENPRFKEINKFLKNIDQVSAVLNQRKSSLTQISNQHNKILVQQKQKITEYYDQIHEIINEHMLRVFEELETEYKKKTKDIDDEEASVNKALKNMKDMKDDIDSSINSAIEAEESEYQSVMNEYYYNLEECKKLQKRKSIVDQEEPNQVRRLVFGDIQPVLEGITHLLGQKFVVEWDDQVDQDETDKNQLALDTNVYRQPARNLGCPQSERQNPIECLETEERNKSNLKQLGGLFCSFDD